MARASRAAAAALLLVAGCSRGPLAPVDGGAERPPDLPAPRDGAPTDGAPAVGWSAPELLTTAARSGPPALAVDGLGHGAAFWGELGGGIHGRRFTWAERRWGALMFVAPAAGHPSTPRAAASRAGAVLVSHALRLPAEVHALVARDYQLPEDRWSPARQLDSAPAIVDDITSVVADDGGAMVAWVRGVVDVVVSRREGQSWQPPQVIDGVSTLARDPQLALTPHGALALWAQAHDGLERLFTARFDGASQSWSAPLVLASGLSPDAAPRLVTDALGNAFAAWLQGPYDGPSELWVRRFDAPGKSWGPPVLLDGGAEHRQPQLAVGGGDAHCVWYDRELAGRVWASRFDGSSGTWGGPWSLTSGKDGARAPVVTADDAGDALALWQQTRGHSPSMREVWTARFDAAEGRWQAPLPLRRHAEPISAAVIAGDPRSGRAMAVWIAGGGPEQELWASAYR